MNKINEKTVSNQPDSNNEKPVLFVALGRQRCGKTVLLNSLLQIYSEKGACIDILNADTQNKTHTLSGFHKNVLSPETSNLAEQQEWIEHQITRLIKEKRDAILDVGGGKTAMQDLIVSFDLSGFARKVGMQLTVAYVIGPEPADLDYYTELSKTANFKPEACLIIFNEALVYGGRDPKKSFTAILKEPVILKAIEEGAELSFMPALPCMKDITDRKQLFKDYADGKPVSGFLESSPFDQMRTETWLNRDMSKFFSSFPRQWLPRLPEGVTL